MKATRSTIFLTGENANIGQYMVRKRNQQLSYTAGGSLCRGQCSSIGDGKITGMT
jgi:hypothetical protein